MTLYRLAWFDNASELTNFLNDNEILKENIVNICLDRFDDWCLIWKEVDSDASDD